MCNTPAVGAFGRTVTPTAGISRKIGALIAGEIERGGGSQKLHRGGTPSRYRLFGGSDSGITAVLASIAIAAALVFIVKPVRPRRHDDVVALGQRQL